MEEFETRVRYIWSETDVDGIFPYVAARHAQIKLRAYSPTRGLKPRVRFLPRCKQFEVEFTVRSIGRPQAVAIDAASYLILRNVRPWAKAENVWRVETETRPASIFSVLGNAR